MSYQEIRDQVADEIALQDSLDNQIGEHWLSPVPDELFTADEHTRIYLPRVDETNYTHTLVLHSAQELADVISAAEELGGGRYEAKNATITHEEQHAAAAGQLGQKAVRYLAHLEIGKPFNLEDGQRVRVIGIMPSVILEDVHVSRLGVGLFLAAPTDPENSTADAERIRSLGYANADAVIKLATQYNDKTRSDTYPIPRH